MRITPKQYAISLFESVSNKKDGEAEAVVKKFFGLLVRNNDLSKSGRIISELARLWNKKSGIVESEVVTARKLDDSSIRSLEKFLSEESGAKKIVINEKVDENILGGVVVRYGDTMLDASLRTKVRDLKSAIKK